MEYNEKTGKWESKYWHPALTTDAVVFGFDKEDGSLQVLLIKRGKAKPGEVQPCPMPTLLEYGWSIGYSHRSELHQQVG